MSRLILQLNLRRQYNIYREIKKVVQLFCTTLEILFKKSSAEKLQFSKWKKNLNTDKKCIIK